MITKNQEKAEESFELITKARKKLQEIDDKNDFLDVVLTDIFCTLDMLNKYIQRLIQKQKEKGALKNESNKK